MYKRQVREFQGNGSVHWHVFTTVRVAEPGEVCSRSSVEWSKWFASYYQKLGASAACVRKMTHGNGSDFIGCCRFEQLQTEAAGRYAGKEGAKRFQKLAPRKWRDGGAWWRASRNVTATPIETVEVAADDLTSSVIQNERGTFDIAHRIQFSLGLKLSGQVPDA